MRMFIGIKLSPENLEKIKQLQDNLQIQGRLTSIDNIHLTLIFLGELNDQDINKVKAILNSLDQQRFTITSSNVEMLRDMVIIKIQNNIQLQNLYDNLHYKLSNAGFKIEERKYFPHITLVRNCDTKIYQNFVITENVFEVILFSSERINGKLTYILRHKIKLNN